MLLDILGGGHPSSSLRMNSLVENGMSPTGGPFLCTSIYMCLGQGKVHLRDAFHSCTSSVICCVGISARITIWRLNISNGKGPSGTNANLAKKTYKKQQNESGKSISTNFPHLQGRSVFIQLSTIYWTYPFLFTSPSTAAATTRRPWCWCDRG